MSRRYFGLPGEWHPLVNAAIAAGWSIEHCRRHIRWKPPVGGFVVTSATPSDRRAMLNARSDLRRRGLKV